MEPSDRSPSPRIVLNHRFSSAPAASPMVSIGSGSALQVGSELKGSLVTIGTLALSVVAGSGFRAAESHPAQRRAARASSPWTIPG